MPRKANLTCDTSEKPFARALSNLMQETGTTQPKLAEYVGCTRQAISLYTTGQSTPDIYTLQKIAKFFDVSYEYLLGETDCKKRENVSFSRNLGLNEAAIDSLKTMKDKILTTTTLNFLLTDTKLLRVLTQYIVSSSIDEEIKRSDFKYVPRNVVCSGSVDKYMFALLIEELPLARVRCKKKLLEDSSQLKVRMLEFLSQAANLNACAEFNNGRRCEENNYLFDEYGNQEYHYITEDMSNLLRQWYKETDWEEEYEDALKSEEEYEKMLDCKYNVIEELLQYVNNKRIEGVDNGDSPKEG